MMMREILKALGTWLVFFVIVMMLFSCDAHAVNWGNLMYFHQGVASKPFAVTIPDSGDGSAASYTLTSPVFATYRYTCADTHGCTFTVGETNVVDGQYLTIYNVGSPAITLTASAGVLQLSTATFAMAQYQQIYLQYQSDRWVEVSRGGASIGSGAIDTTANYTWTGKHTFTKGGAATGEWGTMDFSTTYTTFSTADAAFSFVGGNFYLDPASDPAKSIAGFNLQIGTPPTENTNFTQPILANFLAAYTEGTGTVASLRTNTIRADKYGTGPVTEAIGLNMIMTNQDASGAIGTGTQILINTPTATGAITTYNALHIKDSNIAGITTARSILVEGDGIVEFDPVVQADGGVAVGIQGAYSTTAAKTLVESSATAFVQIDVASDSFESGLLHYVIRASSAGEIQARSGVLPFVAVNDTGTEICTIGTVGAATEVVAVSSGTLTNTFTCTTTPTNGILLNANAASSLTQTTLNITYWVELSSGAATITAQ